MSVSIADRVTVRLGGSAAQGGRDPTRPHADFAGDAVVASTRELLGISRWRGAATGHQPIFWHGGILAKAACAALLSRDSGSGWLHVVADHDAVDPTAVPYPARRGEEPVRRAIAHFGPPTATGTAASAIPPSEVRSLERALAAPPASAGIAECLTRIASALAAADASRGAAWRTVDANFALLSGMGALERPSLILCASALLHTPLGRVCVERIAADPEACARAFNGALSLAPRAASRLRVDGDASEVPLWERGDGGVRTRISGLRLRALLRDGALDAADAGTASGMRATHSGTRGTAPLPEAARSVLLPRAFLATGLVRALGIHFVHGTGGETYERAGDAWWRTALDRPLPPFSVATADLRFTPASVGIRADAAPAPLSWRDAWVDPARLDGMPQDPERAKAIAAIAALPRRSSARRQAFTAMRARVSAMRERHRHELDALASADAAQRIMRASVDAATDRTYPAVLHDAATLAALVALVAGAVSASSVASGASGSRR